MKLVKFKKAENAEVKKDTSVKETQDLEIKYQTFLFVQFPVQAFQDMNLTPYDVRVLGCVYLLVDKAENDKAMLDINYDMKVTISISNLMAECGLSKNKVKECMENLKKFRYLDFTAEYVGNRKALSFKTTVCNPANCKAVAVLKNGGKKYNILKSQLKAEGVTEGEVTVCVTAEKDSNTYETKYTGTFYKTVSPEGEVKNGELKTKKSEKDLSAKTSKAKTSNAHTKMKKKIGLMEKQIGVKNDREFREYTHSEGFNPDDVSTHKFKIEY